MKDKDWCGVSPDLINRPSLYVEYRAGKSCFKTGGFDYTLEQYRGTVRWALDNGFPLNAAFWLGVLHASQEQG